MKFQCTGCQTGFAVPDERIPTGKEVRVLCPKCKMPAELRDAPPVSAPQDKMGEAPSSADGEFLHIQEEMSLLDMVDEDVKTALLCFSNPRRVEKVRSAVSQMGFHGVVAQSASSGRGKTSQFMSVIRPSVTLSVMPLRSIIRSP